MAARWTPLTGGPPPLMRSRAGSVRARTTPRAFVETAWWEEEWTRGCSFAALRPGILSRFGPLLREPLGTRALGRDRDRDAITRGDGRRGALR